MAANVAAVLVAAAVLVLLAVGDRRRRAAGALAGTVPGWLSWIVGGLGVLAVAIPVAASWLAPDGVDRLGAAWLFPVSISLGLVGLGAGAFALVRGDRSWRMWAGLTCGGLVTAFWLFFLAGEILWPH